MKKTIFLLSLLTLWLAQAGAQPLKTKVIDNGGSGQLKAIAVKEAGLPDFVIYRPENLQLARARCGTLPLLVFGNGGCADSSIGYERMLTEIASHGYVVVAIGELQEKRGDRKEGFTPSSDIKRGMDWMIAQNRTKGSDYYQYIDTAKVAAAGHSCGGAQVLANAANPLLKTYLILNAGMGDMTMADASSESLRNVHGPILYVVGGPSDVAYKNAQTDYDRLHHVPVVLANHPASGHGGTYHEPNGGDYGRLVIDWLDWHLKGKKKNADIFLNGNLADYKGWDIKKKNFKVRIGRLESRAMPCKLLKGISEREYSIYLPGSYDENSSQRYPVLYLMHGGGETHTDWQRKGGLRQLADSLIDCGATAEMIIVCPEGNKQHMMYFNAPHWRYEDYFFNELMPYIEKTFRADASRTGIAGFSMGGGAAVVYGIHRPEKFRMVYDISGYLRRQPLDFLKNDPSAEWRQRVIEDNNPIKRVEKAKEADTKAWQKVDWVVSVGDQDFTLEANMDLVKAFRARRIPYTMHVSEGNHDWNYVRPALEDAIRRFGRISAAEPAR